VIVQTQDGHDFEVEEVKAMDLCTRRFQSVTLRSLKTITRYQKNELRAIAR
jgi:hypothetical protein